MVGAHSLPPFLVFLQEEMPPENNKTIKRKKGIDSGPLGSFLHGKVRVSNASTPIATDAIPQLLEKASGNFADKCHFLNLAFRHLINQ